MKPVRHLLLYIALGLGANGAAAEMSDLEALRDGDMKKLSFHATPEAAPDVAFETVDGSAATLADYAGQHVVLNFWATWCAPCRHEMPTLSGLQEALGAEDFAVVTIATGRNPPPAMKKFFDDIGVENLPLHRDPKSALARAMGVFGLPITVLLDPQGREIARLQGDADWNSDSARAIISAWTRAGES